MAGGGREQGRAPSEAVRHLTGGGMQPPSHRPEANHWQWQRASQTLSDVMRV